MSDIVYIRRNLMAMSFLGLWDFWQFKQPVKRVLFQLYGMGLYVCFVVFNVTQFIDMYESLNDVSLLMANAGVTLLYFVTCFKAFLMHFRKNRIANLLDKMRSKEGEIWSKRDEQQIRIYEQCVSQNWFVTKLFWFVVGSTLIFFYLARPVEFSILGPQEVNGFKPPMFCSSWFPYDKFADGYYTLSYAIQLFCGSTGASFIALSDTFLIACMIFPIGQFRMIQNRIERLHERESDREDNREAIVGIVKEHVQVITYLIDLDDAIKMNIFVNFLTCSLLICAVGLEGIISGLSIRFGLNAYYLMALLIQLFMYYWHANEVSLESVRVGRAVSRCQWYLESNQVQKALLLIMIRSQRPCTLSVGGFFPMSLQMFLAILKTTYSFLALFRKVYTRQENNP